MTMYIRLKDKKLSFSKLKFVSLKAKKNRNKSGIKLKTRLIKLLLNVGTYCTLFVGSEIITLTKYN